MLGKEHTRAGGQADLFYHLQLSLVYHHCPGANAPRVFREFSVSEESPHPPKNFVPDSFLLKMARYIGFIQTTAVGDRVSGINWAQLHQNKRQEAFGIYMLGCPKGKVLEDTGVGRDLVITIRPPVCLRSCPTTEIGRWGLYPSW